MGTDFDPDVARPAAGRISSRFVESRCTLSCLPSTPANRTLVAGSESHEFPRSRMPRRESYSIWILPLTGAPVAAGETVRRADAVRSPRARRATWSFTGPEIFPSHG